MPKNNLFVIIHGHFYQPPREDPWTLEVDKQPSAYPFHDWNERINKECYSANAASRVLDGAGRIEEIVNNYNSISFNFGPTLIQWLKKYDPVSFERIVNADIESRLQNHGHGNAIAQVYNHIIMPLANDRDIITEIEWGLRSFRNDFGREPEGIWLAETAVNDRIAEFLIRYGIKFIILSPTQAKECKPMGSEPGHAWKDVSDNTIDPSRPYLLKENNGEIAVFFYNGDLAKKLSFEHLLRNVDFFRRDILSLNNVEKENDLVHVATDGENYGHHEPFGDMCLSRLIYENKTRKDFTFTNYGRFLEMFPPSNFVRLKEGNENLGTAWSCGHGVDRWRNDCGCSTGGQTGWNQNWRGPLRQAFDYLRDTLQASAEKALQPCCRDVWKARNAYADVVLSQNMEKRSFALETFFSAQCYENIIEKDRHDIIRIMEALHNGLLMYTSCGWFFSEISGIETVQDMRYAGIIFDLAGNILPPETKDRFLELLGEAPSNIGEFQNGKKIFDIFIEKKMFSENHCINEYLLISILTKDSIPFHQEETYYFYRMNIIHCQLYKKDSWQIYKFHLSLRNQLLGVDAEYLVYIFRCEDNFKTFIRNNTEPKMTDELDAIVEKGNVKNIFKDFLESFGVYYSLTDLNYDAKEKLLKRMFEKSMQTLHRKMSSEVVEVDRYLDIIELYEELGVRLPEHDTIAIKELLNNAVLCQLQDIDQMDLNSYNFTKLIKVIHTAKKARFQINYTEILPYIRNFVLHRMNRAVIDFDTQELENLEKVIDFTNMAGIDFEKYEIQNLLYDQLAILVNAPAPFMNHYTISILLRLASKFNISIHLFEPKLRAKFTQ